MHTKNITKQSVLEHYYSVPGSHADLLTNYSVLSLPIVVYYYY